MDNNSPSLSMKKSTTSSTSESKPAALALGPSSSTPTKNKRKTSSLKQSQPHHHQKSYQNPLFIPKVLQNILPFLEVEDLKAARLVCHNWHPECTSHLSSRVSPVLFHDKVEWKRFMKVFGKSCSSPKMTKLGHVHPFHGFSFFSTYPEDPSATPYKTAILDYMHAKYRLPRKSTWDTRFFSTYGHVVRNLKYVQFNLYSEQALREFREMLAASCPNLEGLTLQLQKEAGGSNVGSQTSTGSTGSSTTPTTTPTPSPSPYGMAGGGGENVFFSESAPLPSPISVPTSLTKLKRFTLSTDNKCFLSPHALEEFLLSIPSLQEFTYRYTGAKKQWTLVRRVDIIDVLCAVLSAGLFSSLTKLDLDPEGTVLSGEDFKKLSCASNNLDRIKLVSFGCQVFIKTEPDWESLTGWLSQVSSSLTELDIQVRTNFPQFLSEQELPALGFPNVRRAKLLLDSNLNTWLRRLPRVTWFTGVYDNELVPLSEPPPPPPPPHSMSCYDDEEEERGSKLDQAELMEKLDGLAASGGSGKNNGKKRGSILLSRMKKKLSLEDRRASFDVSSSTGGGYRGCPHNSLSIDSSSLSSYSACPYEESPVCPSASHLRIQGNDEFALDMDWKVTVFPNITSFESDIYFDEDLRQIWLHLQNKVKRLVVHLRKAVPEQAFTGAGVATLGPSSFKSSGCGSHCTNFHDDEYLSGLQDYPNITLLSSTLEVLEIHTGARQDAYGSQFSGSLVVYGASLLGKLRRLVLPPSIPPKCLEESLRYLSNLKDLTYLSVCDDTFNSVLPFHMLKLDVPNLEIVVRYYQPEIKRNVGNYWRLERFVFPDFLPEHGRKVVTMDKRHSVT